MARVHLTRPPAAATVAGVVACVVAPCAYTVAALISWGGLAFWYWLPAPIYFVLTMNIDSRQLVWTALAFFWEVPVVGGAFLMMAQRLYPSRRRSARGPSDGLRYYRTVLRYPTTVAALLFVFTLAGYGLGALQLRLFAALPLVEQVKNVAHGLVISLLLAVFYSLALDRVLEPVRSRIAREYGFGTIVARTVATRILGMSLATTSSSSPTRRTPRRPRRRCPTPGARAPA